MTREEEGNRRIDLWARIWACRNGLHRRHNKGRPSSTRYAQSAEPTTAQAARFGYTGGWLGRLLNAFVG